MNNQKKILIAPLDWGNGHFTRCIPIIKALQSEGVAVFVACPPIGKKILESEIQNIHYIDFSGYNIQYAGNPYFFAIKIAIQIPKIIAKIIQEHFMLKKLVKDYNIDAVISDNRYGMWHSKITSVFITHQLNIQVPSSKVLYDLVNKINRWFITKYNACWVPDTQVTPMAGTLSKQYGLSNVNYIGNLSRLEVLPTLNITYDILMILSGPEPQRSILEKKLIGIDFGKKKVCLIRGIKTENNVLNISQSISVINYCNYNELQNLINSSSIIICRSGYSTVMDLFKLKKKAILIPTPGQTEQEYLADYLKDTYDFEKIEQTDLERISIFVETMPPSFLNELRIKSHFDDSVIKYFVTTLNKQARS